MVIKRTIREQVTREIRDELVTGSFSAGQVLREAELASRYGVSRGPIRDAFLQLSQEGLLAYQANRGVTVRDAPHPENRPFILSLRTQIETWCVTRGLAALTDGGLAAVELALISLESSCRGGNVAAIARDDMAFHEAVLIGCGGEEFVQPWRQLCSRMLLAYTRLDDYREVYDEHAAILNPLRARDAEAVNDALHRNIA